jgi:Zinc finger C-x8-C-x5-C-x3-H type (and similar).
MNSVGTRRDIHHLHIPTGIANDDTTNPGSCPSRKSNSHNYDSLFASSKNKEDVSTGGTLKHKDHCNFPSYIPSYKKSKLLSNSFAFDGSLEESQVQTTSQEATDTTTSRSATMMNLLLHGHPSSHAHDHRDYHHDASPREYKSSHPYPAEKYQSSEEMSDFFSIMKGSMTPSSSGRRSINDKNGHKRYPNASPVPSLASSEYSMSSPCSFLEDDPMSTPRNVSRVVSPVMFTNRTPSLQDDVSFATCMGGNMVSSANMMDNACTPTSYYYKNHTPHSNTSHAYYFTPVVQPPLSEHNGNLNNSFKEEFHDTYYSPSAQQNLQGPVRCMEVSTSTHTSTECDMLPKNVEVTKVSPVGASNHSSLSRNSYLSTAIRGYEASKNMANVLNSVVSNQSPVSHRVNSSHAQTVQVSPQSLSPLPQNLKGDPLRQAKVKTELCLFFSRGKPCPFGEKCNYAHGEDELKYTKLVEMDRAGLVADIKSYRAYPCFSWVSTGAW